MTAITYRYLVLCTNVPGDQGFHQGNQGRRTFGAARSVERGARGLVF